MVLTRRVKWLERSRPRMVACRSCGGMDTVKQGSPVRFATLLPDVDGRALVICRLCGECYEGRLVDPDANGAVRLADVVPGESPV